MGIMGVFKAIKDGFITFGIIMSSIVNFFLLLIVYLLGVGISSLMFKVSGKHFLELGQDKTKRSYWEKFEESKRFKQMF